MTAEALHACASRLDAYSCQKIDDMVLDWTVLRSTSDRHLARVKSNQAREKSASWPMNWHIWSTGRNGFQLTSQYPGPKSSTDHVRISVRFRDS